MINLLQKRDKKQVRKKTSLRFLKNQKKKKNKQIEASLIDIV